MPFLSLGQVVKHRFHVHRLGYHGFLVFCIPTNMTSNVTLGVFFFFLLYFFFIYACDVTPFPPMLIL